MRERELPLPPHCTEHDYVGVSHSALVSMLRSPNYSDADLRQQLILQIEKNGATHNQRALLQLACEACADQLLHTGG